MAQVVASEAFSSIPRVTNNNNNHHHQKDTAKIPVLLLYHGVASFLPFAVVVLNLAAIHPCSDEVDTLIPSVPASAWNTHLG
jgi:hypothetical protein